MLDYVPPIVRVKNSVRRGLREFLILWALLTLGVALFIPGIFRSPAGDAVFLVLVGMFVFALPAAIVLWVLYRIVRFAI